MPDGDTHARHGHLATGRDRSGSTKGVAVSPVPEKDEQESGNDEALPSPEQERPLDNVNARFCDLTLQSRESCSHILTECRHLAPGGHVRPQTGNLLAY